MTARVIHIDGKYLLDMPCPKFGRCPAIELRQGPASPADASPRYWGWDGNADAPTIVPSVGCDAKPRCGQHRVITKGNY